MVEMINEFTNEEMLKIRDEFKRINDNIYLDHAGTALYSEKQIDCVSKLLKENLFCNPHTCKITGDLVDQVRFKVLRYFNTNSDKYSVIFTGNASAALKTVAESFDFGLSGSFYYCQENHTSVIGMREIVQTNDIFVLTKNEIVENMNEKGNRNSIETHSTTGNSLVAFSAQCNLSGYKMPLNVIDLIIKSGLVENGECIRGSKENSTKNNNFFICLDAASFVATNYLDLSVYKPDFVCISFYKVFGYPTGLGALIVSKRAQNILKKKYFGGGSVKLFMTRKDFHMKRDGISEHFEDGTLSFLGIASALEGFRTIERLVPSNTENNSQQRISKHVFNLAKYFYECLKNKKHFNGQQLIEFYNHTNYASSSEQGGIVCFNILHDDGSYVGFAEVACLAAVHNIVLRTGCFCNAGACQEFLKLKNDEILKHFEAGHVCSDYNDLIDGQPTGCVRVSFGYITQKSDVDAVIKMILKCYIQVDFSERLELMESKKIPKALSHIPKLLARQNVKLQKICVYPVKSCAAFDVVDETKWEITECGLKYDRIWMVVDANGMAVTQKTVPKLCCIKPYINLDSNKLVLKFSGHNDVSVPLEMIKNKRPVTGILCQSKVCGDSIEGNDCGVKVNKWLSEALNTPGLRLIRQSDNLERKKKDGNPKEINLSNQAQFLLINQTSVAWLSEKVEKWDILENSNIEDITRRFRANFIIETNSPLDENSFVSLRIGDFDFNLEGPCTRCQMICIDQNSGEKTVEPLRTIAKEFKGKIRFGIYLSQKQSNINKARYISCQDKIIFKSNI